jgi:hypothetical protein
MAALFLGYFGVLLFGFIGVAIALLVVEIFMSIFVIPVSLKISLQRFDDWLRAVIRPPLYLIHHVFNGLRVLTSIPRGQGGN